MKKIIEWVKKEKEIVLFVLWTASIVLVGGEVYQHLAELAEIVVLYLVFDALYYGSQILAASTAAAKEYAERLQQPTIWDKIIGGAARDDRSRVLAWVAVVVGLLQPATAFVVAAGMLGLQLRVHWPGYGYLVYDFVSTLLVWRKVLRDIQVARRGRVWAATVADIPQLREVEKAAFPDPSQQFSEGEIRRALTTSPGTTLALELDGRIIGAVYGRPICADEYRWKQVSPTWSEMANRCDFTPPPGADALYIVNIAGLPGSDVTERLEAAVGRLVVQRGLKYVWGGPRIPDFHRWAPPEIVAEYLKDHEVGELLSAMLALRPPEAPNGVGLEEYVMLHGQDGWPVDRLLRKLVKEGGFSLGRRIQLLKVIGGLEEYFGDPPSLDRGALVEFKNPFYGWPLSKLWGWLLEQALLHF